jgi:hypothetical protein
LLSPECHCEAFSPIWALQVPAVEPGVLSPAAHRGWWLVQAPRREPPRAGGAVWGSQIGASLSTGIWVLNPNRIQSYDQAVAVTCSVSVTRGGTVCFFRTLHRTVPGVLVYLLTDFSWLYHQGGRVIPNHMLCCCRQGGKAHQPKLSPLDVSPHLRRSVPALGEVWSPRPCASTCIEEPGCYRNPEMSPAPIGAPVALPPARPEVCRHAGS